MQAGVPPQDEYGMGNLIPQVPNQWGTPFRVTQWRCRQCGHVLEAGQFGTFPACPDCGGLGWGFVGGQD
jgi:rubrerythrin